MITGMDQAFSESPRRFLGTKAEGLHSLFISPFAQVPLGQSVHLALPLVCVKVPGKHFEHFSAASKEKKPMLQRPHIDMPFIG